MTPEEPARRDEMTEDEMSDVQARTTPGTDPRVEELRREQEMRDRPAGYAAEDDRAAAPAYGGVNQDTAYQPGPAERGTVMDRGNMVDQGEYASSAAGETGMEAYRTRFADAQARFIDDPKGAVNDARSVLEEAVDRFMNSVSGDDGAADDTERMRMAMQRYRSLFERLVESGR